MSFLLLSMFCLCSFRYLSSQLGSFHLDHAAALTYIMEKVRRKHISS